MSWLKWFRWKRKIKKIDVCEKCEHFHHVTESKDVACDLEDAEGGKINFILLYTHMTKHLTSCSPKEYEKKDVSKECPFRMEHDLIRWNQ